MVRRIYRWEWPRSFPIVQFPNWPLLVGLAGSALGISAVATAGYAVWAGWELVDGDNWFRRVLGAAGLVWVVLRVV